MVDKRVKQALSLAELLVTVAIIGVIGVITLGIVRSGANQVEFRVAQAKMMDSVSTALATMQLDNQLAGLGNTNSFAEKFQTYYSATSMSAAQKAAIEANVSKLPADVKAALKNDSVYLIGANGEFIALSYNADYAPSSRYVQMAKNTSTSSIDSVDLRNDAIGAISGFYDVNGLSAGPNKIGKDINIIQPYAGTGTKTCEGNEILDVNGECICSITANECISMGKTFNSAACTCEVNCPIGKVPDENGVCVCSLNAESCRAPYSEFDPVSCTCKTSVGVVAKCKENGGVWNEDEAYCECYDASDERSCEARTHGYASADPDNFCKCTCKDQAAIVAQIAANASNRADINIVKEYTIPTDDVENGCFYCKQKADTITAFNIEEEDGICGAKSLVSSEDCPNDGVFTVWQDFNPSRPNDSFYCKCILTQEHCNSVLNTAHKEYYGYGARTNTCLTDSWDSCRRNVNACIADPKSNDCKNTIGNCGNSRSSTPHYACSMAFHGSWKNTVKNGSLVAQNPSTGKFGPAANATADTCYCAVSNGYAKASVPRTTYFHGAYGIAEANRYNSFTGYDLPEFKGAYVDSEKMSGPIKNVMVLESYSSWYDPIVLNVNADNPFGTPSTTAVDVDFKDYEGNPIKTAWIAQYSVPTYYFLVNDSKEPYGQVNDLSELYSESGGLVTGLQMLNMTFKDYIKQKKWNYTDEQVKDAQIVIGYPELANKGLMAWADMNANATVDGDDEFVPLLQLHAKKVERKRESSANDKENKYSFEHAVMDSFTGGEYSNRWQEPDKYEFDSISGLGVFQIYTGYTMISTTTGKPERSANSTVAIQSKYSILKPINGLSQNSTWVQIVPTKEGDNPAIKFVDENGNDVKNLVIDEPYINSNSNLQGVNKLVWEYKVHNKQVRLYLKVGDQLYEVQIRGLTDVIFDKE